MCRWLAYSGSPVLLDELLFKPQHSLIDQSMSAKSADTVTNGDGFGLGWYDPRGRPTLFRSIRPAWNDFNLREICSIIESPLFLAHVRAASHAAVQETNCHPFRKGRWLFVHNGEIHGIEKIRRELLFAVDPELFPHINGTTDSEVMFYLMLTFGLDQDPLGAAERMAGFVEAAARKRGVSDPLWMTLGFSDGEILYAVRYASDRDAPTLFHSRELDDLYRINPALLHRREMDDLYQINPALRRVFARNARAVVSEPLGNLAAAWTEIPQATALIVRSSGVESRPFIPKAP